VTRERNYTIEKEQLSVLQSRRWWRMIWEEGKEQRRRGATRTREGGAAAVGVMNLLGCNQHHNWKTSLNSDAPTILYGTDATVGIPSPLGFLFLVDVAAARLERGRLRRVPPIPHAVQHMILEPWSAAPTTQCCAAGRHTHAAHHR
jgi:hypothetical protein